jgi:hypothetical protein
MRFVFLLLLSLVVAAGGCGSEVGMQAAPSDKQLAQAASAQEEGNVPVSRRPGIDDDREAAASHPVLDTVLLPVKATGVLVAKLVDLPVRGIQYASGDTPGHAARMIQDTNSPDNRREGISKLVEYDFAKRPPSTTLYKQIAEADSDPMVRAVALRASNRARDRSATPLFIKGLSDQTDLVRLEAAKGLANLPDANAADPLTKVAMTDDNRDVRVAATDALKYYKSLQVARTLTSLLVDHDFSVAWQARRSLDYLTGKDFGYDQGKWLGYFSGPATPFG